MIDEVMYGAMLADGSSKIGLYRWIMDSPVGIATDGGLRRGRKWGLACLEYGGSQVTVSAARERPGRSEDYPRLSDMSNPGGWMHPDHVAARAAFAADLRARKPDAVWATTLMACLQLGISDPQLLPPYPTRKKGVKR